MSARSITDQDVTLVELLDRLLDTGVVVRGDICISVAEVDLVYLQVNLLLTSIAKMTEVCQPASINRSAAIKRSAISTSLSATAGEKMLYE